jgi:probable HAF family extracellular repeat protein
VRTVFAVSVLLCATLALGASIRYITVDLGTIDGDSSQASAINNRGVIVGSSVDASNITRAVVWWKGGVRVLDPPNPDAGNYWAIDINNNGTIVGQYFNVSTQSLAGFLYRAGTIVDLGTFVPSAVNDSGQMIGRVSGGWAALWQKGVITQPGQFYAEDINNRGQISGLSADGRAVVWYKGNLGYIGPHNSTALAINNAGIVAGQALVAPFIEHAVIWRSGQTIDLGIPVGCITAGAKDINSRGVVVVDTLDASRNYQAFVYVNRRYVPLPAIVPGNPSYAQAINEQGDVIGYSSLGTITHATLWARCAK